MPTLTCDISQSLWTALQRTATANGETIRHLVSRALADSLQVEHRTLFQVSTSGAIVEGVFDGVVSIGTLREHGDFGLGTFVDLDGEMIALDGEFFQIQGDGRVCRTTDDQHVPFAVVTRFVPEHALELGEIGSIAELYAQLDAQRSSDNLFYAVRIDGRFAQIHNRVACKAEGDEGLVAATSHQAEFTDREIDGTLIGFWTPAYAKTIGISGWHLHFISNDRHHGGHLLGLSGAGWRVGWAAIDDMRVAIPETAAFLAADLAHDPSEALDKAERAQG